MSHCKYVKQIYVKFFNGKFIPNYQQIHTNLNKVLLYTQFINAKIRQIHMY